MNQPVKLNRIFQQDHIQRLSNKLGSGRITKWERPTDKRYTSIQHEFFTEGFISMPGPGDFVLLVGKHLCELSSSIRWAAFLDNEEIQEDLRAIAFELSSWLGNPLYAPDLFGLNAYLFDEHTMQEARIWLYREYGDPSSDMKSMLHDWKAENEYRKYYIDEFTD